MCHFTKERDEKGRRKRKTGKAREDATKLYDAHLKTGIQFADCSADYFNEFRGKQGRGPDLGMGVGPL
jgi:hypothetical protein